MNGTKDNHKTKDQLIKELAELRRRVSESEGLKAKCKKAEEAARVAQDRLNDLLSSSPGVIYRCKPSGDFRTTFVSENLTSHLGYETRAFLEDSRFWADRIHPEDRPQVFASLARLFEKGRHSCEYRFLHRDGTYRSMHDEMKLVRNKTNIPVEIVSLWIDITDHMRVEEALQESEAKYRTIFETAGTAMAIIEDDTTISLVNSRFEKLSGFSKKEIEGKKSWNELVAEGYPERMKPYPLGRRMGPGAVSMNYETRFTDKEGIPRDVFVTVAIIPGTKKSVAALLDITRFKETEWQLKKTNEELEGQVLERTVQLEAASKELEAFAYSVSHDLRSPLLVINGFARSLMENYSRRLDAKGQQFLDILQRNTQNMLQLIDDLLTFSRLGNQPMQPSDIDMAELARSVFEELKAFSPERSLHLDLKALPAVHGDRTMVRQVLANLLSNAIKFTTPKGKPEIEIGSIAKENQIAYYVKDNGVGFDMQHAGRLFGVLQRLHPVEEFGGTGIGLAIVRCIVQRHGGWVWAEGKVNEGATFYFSFPRVKTEALSF